MSVNIEEDAIRQRLLEKIDDLRNKINSNEPLPEAEQDQELWFEILDNIDLSLSNWYY